MQYLNVRLFKLTLTSESPIWEYYIDSMLKKHKQLQFYIQRRIERKIKNYKNTYLSNIIISFMK